MFDVGFSRRDFPPVVVVFSWINPILELKWGCVDEEEIDDS